MSWTSPPPTSHRLCHKIIYSCVSHDPKGKITKLDPWTRPGFPSALGVCVRCFSEKGLLVRSRRKEKTRAGSEGAVTPLRLTGVCQTTEVLPPKLRSYNDPGWERILGSPWIHRRHRITSFVPKHAVLCHTIPEQGSCLSKLSLASFPSLALQTPFRPRCAFTFSVR